MEEKNGREENGIGDLVPDASCMQHSGERCAGFKVFEIVEGREEEERRQIQMNLSVSWLCGAV